MDKIHHRRRGNLQILAVSSHNSKRVLKFPFYIFRARLYFTNSLGPSDNGRMARRTSLLNSDKISILFEDSAPFSFHNIRISASIGLRSLLTMRCSLILCCMLTASVVRAFSSCNPPVTNTLKSSASSFTRMASVSSPDTDGTLPQLLLSVRGHLGTSEGKIRLILASQSPRRKEILDMMGLKDLYEVIHSPLDESALQSQLLDEEGSGMPEPKTYTRVLAEEKAKALAMEISSQVTQPTIVLGSDTIVAWNDSILEKPKDTAEAKIMLTQLSGSEHTVHTGVAIYRVLPQALSDEPVTLVASFVDSANVRFAPLSGADINAYIATGEPMDKAGSYGIQGIGGQLVASMEGDFFTVSSSIFSHL
jgi:septum formation protein